MKYSTNHSLAWKDFEILVPALRRFRTGDARNYYDDQHHQLETASKTKNRYKFNEFPPPAELNEQKPKVWLYFQFNTIANCARFLFVFSFLLALSKRILTAPSRHPSIQRSRVSQDASSNSTMLLTISPRGFKRWLCH